ncbi:MAG TPA: asparaginase [Candidatus Lumbricidophila sp.]|nr:asparaginase [Candidatus Lumbricidophila sp.]
MSGTFQASDCVELATVERDGFVESRHIGCAVVLAPDGTALRTYGSPTAPILPRSALKPFQAVAVMTSGVQLRGEDAVIAMASHSGTIDHVRLVGGLLSRAGLTIDALRCPSALPHDRAAREQLIRAGQRGGRAEMTCSGKHAAMLLACVTNQWPTESYLHPEHPMQKKVADVIERFTGERPAAVVTDGCGLPAYAVTLAGLARGIHRIATSQPSSPFALFREAGVLTAEVRAHPWVVAGAAEPDTLVTERLGVFAKFGAEGVMVMVAPNGTTVALKMLDGSARAATIVALRLLAAEGAIDDAAVDALEPELGLLISGGAAPVGRIRASISPLRS